MCVSACSCLSVRARVCSIYIFGYIFSFRYDVRNCFVSLGLFMGKSKFRTAQKRQSEKEMAKHRKQFVPLSCKASSGLYYFFSIHRVDFTSFFLAHLSGSLESGPWSFTKLSFILDREWKCIHRRASQFSIHWRCPFFVHVTISIHNAHILKFAVHLSSSFTFACRLLCGPL